jgi:hypothetical protein
VLMVQFNQPGSEAAYAWMETQMSWTNRTGPLAVSLRGAVCPPAHGAGEGPRVWATPRGRHDRLALHGAPLRPGRARVFRTVPNPARHRGLEPTCAHGHRLSKVRSPRRGRRVSNSHPAPPAHPSHTRDCASSCILALACMHSGHDASLANPTLAD